MKTLQTSCQVCRKPLEIEVEEPAMFSDEVMMAMAVCDPCSNDHDERERTRIAKYHKAIERETREYKQPYKD